MKRYIVHIFTYLVIFALLLQTSPSQAIPAEESGEIVTEEIMSLAEPTALTGIPQGLTGSEWESIQGQIRADISQDAYLKASNTGTSDNFGESVAIYGDTLVVGAPLEDGSSASSTNNTGAVYVFVRDGSSWAQEAILHSSTEAYYDYLGSRVAIFEDTIVASAQMPATMTGAVYVFTRTGSSWSQQARIQPENIDSGDNFGGSIDIENDVLVIGASSEDSANNDPDNNLAVNAGAAYIFTRQNNVWSQQAYLKAPIIEKYDAFGSSVAISGSTVVVGSSDPYISTTGIESVGSAYVFIQDASSWSLQSILTASNGETNDRFGESVDIMGNTCVVGAPYEDSSSTGVDGEQTNNDAENSGAAYVFTRSGGFWSQDAYLKASNTDPGDWFGSSVRINNNLLLIGAANEDSNAIGVNGNDDDNSFTNSGASYLYSLDTHWNQTGYIKASNTDIGDSFGRAVDIYEDTIIIGAPNEDSISTGVNGDQNNNSYGSSGAAYVFSVDHMPTAGLEISHIEVNQATQDINNSIPLIAGKPTQVSVFVTSLTGEDMIVTGVLRGFDATTGSPISISPINSQNPKSPIPQSWSDTYIYDSNVRFNNALKFLLPYHWTTYYDSIIIEVELMNGVTARKTLEFLDENYLTIKVVPILFEGSIGNTHYVNYAGEIAKSMFPFTHIFMDVTNIPLKWESPLACSGWPSCREADLMMKLKKLKNKDDIDYDFIVGILPESLKPWLTEFVGLAGTGWPLKGVALVYDGYLTDTTFAHELGHLLNQRHVRHDAADCVSGCNSTDCTPFVLIPDWPYATTSIQEPGYDQMHDINYFPSSYDDVMSYCTDKWVSPFRYTNILSHIAARNTSIASAVHRISIPSIEVSGIIFTDGTVDLGPIWFTEETPTWENPEPGTEYCVQALDINAIVLDEICFDLEFLDSETNESINVDIFDVHLPYNADAYSVAIKQGDTLLIEQSVSLHAPAIQLTYPIGGETWLATDLQTITWLGSDEDLDTLFYNVFYSDDGGTLWSPLALDLEVNYLEVDVSTIGGSTDARIKIEVTDGINHGFDTTDTPFTVEGKPPSAEILSPEEGQSFVAGGSVQLQGIGSDTEDGFLDGTQKCWSSDLDGELGCGEIILAVLTPGEHVITLSVEDSAGNSATDTTTILVEECYLLLTNVNPSIAGTVTVELAPNCTANPILYTSGTIVHLNIETNPGFDFLSWSGNASGTDLPLQVTITSDLLIGAKFTYGYSNFLPMVIR